MKSNLILLDYGFNHFTLKVYRKPDVEFLYILLHDPHNFDVWRQDVVSWEPSCCPMVVARMCFEQQPQRGGQVV